MFLQIVLHYLVVSVGINTNVCIMRETIVHDAVENAVNIGVTGYTMNNVIWLFIIKPFAFIYLCIGWIGRRQKGKITYDFIVIFNSFMQCYKSSKELTEARGNLHKFSSIFFQFLILSRLSPYGPVFPSVLPVPSAGQLPPDLIYRPAPQGCCLKNLKNLLRI